MSGNNGEGRRELEVISFEEGEVGETVRILTPVGTVRARWLGTVSNGRELAEAMRLMAAMEDERRATAEATATLLS